MTMALVSQFLSRDSKANCSEGEANTPPQFEPDRLPERTQASDDQELSIQVRRWGCHVGREPATSMAMRGTGVALSTAKSRTRFEIVLAYKIMGFMILFSYTHIIVVYFLHMPLSCLPISLVSFVWPHLNS